MMRFKAIILDNLGVKVIALVVALIIWFNVSSQEQTTRYLELPLRLVNIPDTLTIRGAVPAAVETQITASKRQFLYMGFRKTYLGVNLSGAVPGRFRQVLSGSNVMLPSFLQPVNVRIVSPTYIDIYFERKIVRKVPVMLNTTGSLPEGYVLVDTPRIEPDSVTVTGGESTVAVLKAVSTRGVELSRIKSDYDKEVPLAYDPRSILCEPDEVKVVLSVSERAKRTLANVPPTLLFDGKHIRAEVIPKTVSLTVEGPKAVLDTLTSRDISVLLDLGGRKPGRYVLAPEVIVPAGLQLISLDVDSMVVDLIRTGGMGRK